MTSYDILVVGAGPAGSMASLALARAGYHVGLLDRASFPRPKVCGNCINPTTWKIWQRFGLEDSFRALPHQDFRGFTLWSEDRFVHEHRFRPGCGPRAVGRDVFDDWLLQKAVAAGAEFHAETVVQGVDFASGRLETSRGPFSARLILAADGRNSVVARLCDLMPPPRRCQRVAWQASIPAPADLDDRIHMRLYQEGYFGYCRYSPTQAVFSLVLDSRSCQDPSLFARRYFDLPPGDWMRMNPITRAPAQLGRGRVWLMGDAARVVEPFTGEGIAFALKTALLAADAAQTAFPHTNDLERAFHTYRRQHQSIYRRRAWVNTLVRAALIKPKRTVRVLRRVPTAPALISFLSDRVHAA